MNKDKFFPATIMPDKDWWHALWPNPEMVIRDVGIAAGMRTVDLCCGDGYFTRPMCELSSQVYGLDLDADLLGQTETACCTYSNFQSILGDARDLPQLIDGLVDFVFMANTFHGVPEQDRLSRAINETLNEAGRFAVINWYRRPREETTVLDQPRGPDKELRMQPEDVQQIVEPAGFMLEKIIDVGPYHYGAVFIKSGKSQG
ncbi:ubiquinone/menaquinone biosynthesis C-methylase UbiE [Thiogranum longum]|uniref:Ubiquinone/menaquinone biosynthesis C-methylase UbiE n=1 Tax=Thiogranum longum TaxID=1537524 RepID=A0A4R1HET6_9GAMM|nr:class I SAM-dependent methyltransferase [Thiogranum longum]TCK19163.1 ubiquinone/menaquinone biosynthesis C-methylase UbiE [Thiogranum longum]